MSYKYGHLVAQAIESVLSQTLKPDVIRVYDDGVGDCAEVCKLYPEVEYILREKNLGIVDNFNDALNRTTTEFVMFLGADNWLHPNALEFMYDEEAVISTSWLYLFGTEVDTFRKGLPHELDPESGLWIWKPKAYHGSSLYHVPTAKVVGGYERNPNSTKSEEDSVLFDKMLKLNMDMDMTVVHSEEPLIYYRRHKHNFQ